MTLRHLLFHNYWLKLFSIALGTIIWLAIHHSIDNNFDLSEPGSRQRLVKETMKVPISVVTQEGDPRNFRVDPTNAMLTIVGEAGVLHGPESRDIRIFVDVSDFHSTGPVQLDLVPRLPHDLNVIDFRPHSASVNVETNAH